MIDPHPLSQTGPAAAIPESKLHRLFHGRVIAPILHLLRLGACPRKLAWSLAVGTMIGLNPLLGTTTVVCLVAALGLRLNVIASQITNHLVYPLQLVLFFLFIRAGEVVFRAGPLPFGRAALLSALRHHPLDTTRRLWTWEWHALLVWLVVAAVAAPVLVAVLTPMLRRMLASTQAAPTAE